MGRDQMARTHGDAMIGFKAQTDGEMLRGNMGKAVHGEPSQKRSRRARFRAEQRAEKSAGWRGRKAIQGKCEIRPRTRQRRGEARN